MNYWKTINENEYQQIKEEFNLEEQQLNNHTVLVLHITSNDNVIYCVEYP